MRCTTSLGMLAVLALSLVGEARAQSSEIRGRVMDRESGQGVPDATVILEGADSAFLKITDSRGLFTFEEVGGGEYRVTVSHLAYGEHAETTVVEADAIVALRILIGLQAIELDPLVVEVISTEERERRGRGTMVQEVTRAEIEDAMRTSNHLGDVLRQTVPGLRVYDTSLPGARTCVEFRGRRSIRFGGGCQSPMVIMDGVRMYDPPSVYAGIHPGSIERIEVVPPTEAGLLYGSESAFGVIIIETKVWLTQKERQAVPSHLRGGLYDWSLEMDGHSWERVLLVSLAGNALGLAAGLGIANRCIEVEALARDVFASDCGGWATAGSWVAAVGLPVLGAALGARVAGATSLSQGRLLPAMVAGSVALLPGYALIAGSGERTNTASYRAGQVFVAVGIPVAVTLADKMFRRLRGR